MPRFVTVFTDLDGTLLDHDSYSFAAAAAALDLLRSRGVPLIFCSSKTAAEILPLRAELGFGHCPAIVENGAGVLAASATRPAPASRHAELMQIVDRLPQSLRESFSGFSSWSLAELKARTGLAGDAARRALRRNYSEPGLWLGEPAARLEFIEALEQQGVHAQQGGRFLTLGFAVSKAARMREIIAAYRAQQSDPVFSIALGDAPNDTEMLESADLGIIIPNPAHAAMPPLAGESEDRIMRARRPGPAGWNDSLLDFFEKTESNSGREING